jgi:hypothetical protein
MAAEIQLDGDLRQCPRPPVHRRNGANIRNREKRNLVAMHKVPDRQQDPNQPRLSESIRLGRVVSEADNQSAMSSRPSIAMKVAVRRAISCSFPSFSANTCAWARVSVRHSGQADLLSFINAGRFTWHRIFYAQARQDRTRLAKGG